MSGTFATAGSHPFDCHGKSALCQPFDKGVIRIGRPDRQHPASCQRTVDLLQSLWAVKAAIGVQAPGRRPVIHIEQDGIQASSTIEQIPDITCADLDPRVLETLAVDRVEVRAIPVDDRREDLRHENLCSWRQKSQRRPQGVAEAETPDENSRTVKSRKLATGQFSEKLLRSGGASGHQLFAIEVDEEITVPVVQRQPATIGGGCPIQCIEGAHARWTGLGPD